MARALEEIHADLISAKASLTWLRGIAETVEAEARKARARRSELENEFEAAVREMYPASRNQGF